jgi:hypothetical protein
MINAQRDVIQVRFNIQVSVHYIFVRLQLHTST